QRRSGFHLRDCHPITRKPRVPGTPPPAHPSTSSGLAHPANRFNLGLPFCGCSFGSPVYGCTTIGLAHSRNSLAQPTPGFPLFPPGENRPGWFSSNQTLLTSVAPGDGLLHPCRRYKLHRLLPVVAAFVSPVLPFTGPPSPFVPAG